MKMANKNLFLRLLLPLLFIVSTFSSSVLSSVTIPHDSEEVGTFLFFSYVYVFGDFLLGKCEVFVG